MSEVQVEESVEEPPPPAVELVACALCKSQVPRGDAFAVNGRITCAPCVARVERELAAQKPHGKSLAIAALGGLAGALVGAAVWAGVAVAVELEVGYLAVLVGFLAGYGVKYCAGKQRGKELQILAAGLSVVGLFAAKYMLFAYFTVKAVHEHGVDIGYFDSRLVSLFPSALGDSLGIFDALFLFLAVSAAYRVPKAPLISISRL